MMATFAKRRLPRILAVLLLAVGMLLAYASVGLAAVPTITIVSPSANSYLLRANTYNCSAYIYNLPISKNMYYNNYANQHSLSLIMGSLYAYNFTPSYLTDFVPGMQSGSSWNLRNMYFTASNSSGSASTSIKTFVTHGTLSDYTSNDSTFYYSSPTSSSFAGPATGYIPQPHGTTGTYNCLAYSVDVTTSWQWPWLGYSPSYSEVAAYMAKTGSHSTRPGTTYLTAFQSRLQWAKAIAYGVGGAAYHFAKVVAWDSSGYPSRIRSKWGCCELINSSSYSPFGPNYGTPMGYFK